MDKCGGCNEWGGNGDEWGGRAAMDEVHESWKWMGEWMGECRIILHLRPRLHCHDVLLHLLLPAPTEICI